MILACPQATILNAKQEFCYLFSSRSTSKTVDEWAAALKDSISQ